MKGGKKEVPYTLFVIWVFSSSERGLWAASFESGESEIWLGGLILVWKGVLVWLEGEFFCVSVTVFWSDLVASFVFGGLRDVGGTFLRHWGWWGAGGLGFFR